MFNLLTILNYTNKQQSSHKWFLQYLNLCQADNLQSDDCLPLFFRPTCKWQPSSGDFNFLPIVAILSLSVWNDVSGCMHCILCRARINLQHLYYKKPRTATAIEDGTAIPNNKEKCIDQWFISSVKMMKHKWPAQLKMGRPCHWHCLSLSWWPAPGGTRSAPSNPLHL